MRKYLLAAVAAFAIASPAAARDGAGYIGIEGGLLFAKDSHIDVDVDGTQFNSGLSIDYKRGLDADLIGGYDFGMFRLEAELGWKRAKADQLELSDALEDALEEEFGEPVTADDLDLDGRVRVISLMANGLLDFGNDGVSGFVGAGYGIAGVNAADDVDRTTAWQLLAGVRAAVGDNVDVGLKYRYFRTGRLNYEEEDFGSDLSTRFKSHSLLASLIFNFGAPAAPVEPVIVDAPPPPPPPPPATQTCPDGSVILATDICPAPPPPPPAPPAPTGERG